MMVDGCVVCGAALPAGQFAACAQEQRCLTHCSDFAGHVTILPELEREAAALALQLERDERADEIAPSDTPLGISQEVEL